MAVASLSFPLWNAPRKDVPSLHVLLFGPSPTGPHRYGSALSFCCDCWYLRSHALIRPFAGELGCIAGDGCLSLLALQITLVSAMPTQTIRLQHVHLQLQLYTEYAFCGATIESTSPITENAFGISHG
ncbi:hypothetical protein BO70DRAFT_392462 [Aspergillus heteromorphus CBS 117.55]|uniref:Uncharacterized protein n=1 Tax=Aspergillus heteromorphus CBS 117.55 TaxID=1448321 RepID=A0A317WZS6_9EURO|nr:uncharacterized protein BO70DRAFT_392462 [Aspergillus heteromorphus CBS 117.55]PWY90787.1 hypothetical protein BO70DRAFT_392462 [Aspergillus heteromorphus CBS 117.55]